MGWKRFVLPFIAYFAQVTAGATWSTPVNIVSNSWGSVSAAANTSGQAVVLYSPGEEGQVGIAGIARSFSGDWLNPVHIPKTDNSDEYPIAAIDEDGYSYALWKHTDSNSGLESIMNAMLPAPNFSFWIVSDNFPSTPATSIDDYKIAHDKYSYATAAWSVQRDLQFYIEAAQFDRIAHAWRAIQPLSLGAKCKGFDLKLDSQGTTWLIWVNYSSPTDVVYVTYLLPGNTSWAPPQILAKSKEVLDPQMAIDPKDNILVFWQQNEKKFVNQIYKKMSDSIAWIKTEFPCVKNQSWPDSQVTSDQKGNTLLLWQQSTNITNSASLSARGDKWNKAGVALKEWAVTWRSAIDKKGNRLVVYGGDTKYFKAVTLPAGQSKWSEPSNIAPQFYITAWIDLASFYGDKALIIYEDENAIKVVEGTSLFSK